MILGHTGVDDLEIVAAGGAHPKSVPGFDNLKVGAGGDDEAGNVAAAVLQGRGDDEIVHLRTEAGEGFEPVDEPCGGAIFPDRFGGGFRQAAAAGAAQIGLGGDGVYQRALFDGIAADLGEEMWGPAAAFLIGCGAGNNFGNAAYHLHVHDKAERGAAVSLRQRLHRQGRFKQVGAPATELLRDHQGRQTDPPDVGEILVREGSVAVMLGSPRAQRGEQAAGDFDKLLLTIGSRVKHTASETAMASTVSDY